jgi:tetratricopeptide (TPR) repeat protein
MLKTDYPKKYWWLTLVVVPIGAAVIGLLAAFGPLFFKPTPTSLPLGIAITNNKFAGDLYFVTEVVSTDVSKAQNAQPVVQSATNLVQNKNYGSAISTLEQAAVQYPLPSIYNNLGVLYANQGDYQKAEQAYQSALRLDPNDQTANYNLGLLKQAQGKLDDAKNYLAKAPALQSPERTATLRTLTESPTQTVGLNSLLVEFTRNQNTVTAKIRLINSTTRNIDIGSPTNGSHLLDEATHKQYQVVDQSNTGTITVPANAAIEIWAKYSVPAVDKFQSLSVNFGDGILFERVVVK